MKKKTTIKEGSQGTRRALTCISSSLMKWAALKKEVKNRILSRSWVHNSIRKLFCRYFNWENLELFSSNQGLWRMKKKNRSGPKFGVRKKIYNVYWQQSIQTSINIKECKMRFCIEVWEVRSEHNQELSSQTRALHSSALKCGQGEKGASALCT